MLDNIIIIIIFIFSQCLMKPKYAASHIDQCDYQSNNTSLRVWWVL